MLSHDAPSLHFARLFPCIPGHKAARNTMAGSVVILMIMQNKKTNRPAHATRSLRGLLWVALLALTIPVALSDSATAEKVYSKEFETAVSIIKKYEGLHRNKGRLIGYGHMVFAGDKYKRGSNLTEAQADALLREDLEKLCERYRSFGQDSLILAALAYNCGTGTVAKSSVYKKLAAGDRDIRSSYLSHCRANGKVLSQLKRRRQEEFDSLYIPTHTPS